MPLTHKLDELNDLAADLKRAIADQDRQRVMPLKLGPQLPPPAQNVTEALAFLDRARYALDRAIDYQEVRNCRDTAVSIHAFAREAKDMTLIEKALTIRVRAERKAGEMLLKAREAGTITKRGISRRNFPGTLRIKDLGITKAQSREWTHLATLTPDEFEQGLQAACASKRVSASLIVGQGVLAAGKPKPSRLTLDAASITRRIARTTTFTDEECAALDALVKAWRGSL